MSFADPPEISQERCWELASYFVRAKNAARYSGLLHLPATTATCDEPKPLCGQTLTESGAAWVAKPAEVYPTGFRSVCENCRRAIGNRL